jgi:hypothetical protein
MMKPSPAGSTHDSAAVKDSHRPESASSANAEKQPVLEKPAGPMIYTIEVGARILPFWPRRKGS